MDHLAENTSPISWLSLVGSMAQQIQSETNKNNKPHSSYCKKYNNV